MKEVRCYCINSKDKPSEIPSKDWPIKDKEYKITHIYYHKMQGVKGVDLKEIKPPESAYPYETYKLTRFAVLLDDLDLFFALLKDCNDLNDVELEEVKKQLEPDLQKIEIL